MRLFSSSAPLALLLLGAACSARQLPQAEAPTQAPADEAQSSPEPERISPPPPSPSQPARFPKIQRAALANGLELAVVEAHALPLVQLRLVIQTGSAADSDLTGLSRLTALLLKDGGAGKLLSSELLSRIESLGANLQIRAQRDATVLSLGVPTRHVDEALELLGTIVREPRFDEKELQQLKARERERVLSQAKSSGSWAASMLLWRELYRLPTRLHPYASYDALPSEIDKLERRHLRAFHAENYTPKNARLVMAGDIDLETAKVSTSRFFGSWKGNAPKVVGFASPVPKEELTIFVADRPGSAQSDIYLGLLGPEVRDDAHTKLTVVNQVLGGGVAGRLFLDVREERSLAYSTRSSLSELARGPVPLVLYAGTQTAKTGLAAQALLEHVERLANAAPSAEELETAKRYLVDVLALRMETVGALADMVTSLDVLGLADDHYDAQRDALRTVTAEEALAVSREYGRPSHAVLVVAGDAEKIAPMLSRFGEVRVVNPEEGFVRKATLPPNPSASLELEREPGR